MRISTLFANKIALQQLQRSNEQLGLITHQVTSGLKARRFEDLADDANQLLNLKDVQTNTEFYQRNIQTAVSRLQAQEGALQGVADLIVEAASLWTLARNENSAEVRATMAPKAEGITESFFEIFKTKFDGRFVFSGQGSERPPLTVTPTPNIFPGDPPPTTYYTGDTALPSLITGPGNTQTYGVTGDDLGFARVKAGLEALWFGLQNNSEPDIDGAIDLLNQAQRDVSDMLGKVGGQINGLNLVEDRHENSLVFLQERVDEIEKVDVAEAMSRFAQQQTVLEASMLTLSRINSLSLLDFI